MFESIQASFFKTCHPPLCPSCCLTKTLFLKMTREDRGDKFNKLTFMHAKAKNKQTNMVIKQVCHGLSYMSNLVFLHPLEIICIFCFL